MAACFVLSSVDGGKLPNIRGGGTLNIIYVVYTQTIIHRSEIKVNSDRIFTSPLRRSPLGKYPLGLYRIFTCWYSPVLVRTTCSMQQIISSYIYNTIFQRDFQMTDIFLSIVCCAFSGLARRIFQMSKWIKVSYAQTSEHPYPNTRGSS